MVFFHEAIVAQTRNKFKVQKAEFSRFSRRKFVHFLSRAARANEADKSKTRVREHRRRAKAKRDRETRENAKKSNTRSENAGESKTRINYI